MSSHHESVIVALCYDFDKTLAPLNMQEHGFIDSLNLSSNEFWRLTDDFAEQNDMDIVLAYMYMMLTLSRDKYQITREKLVSFGSDIKFFPGLDTWFSRVNTYASKKNIKLEHYIISSGIKEMIEGSPIASSFKRIYACSFAYDDKGVALWPAQAVNYTNKTQFLFRIEKGTLDVNDEKVNDYFAPDEVRIPLSRMIYVGDSETDIPCMRIINSSGGYSIGVFNPYVHDKKHVHKMMRDGRISFFAPSDYSAGAEMEKLVMSIVDKIAADETLSAFFRLNHSEVFDL